MEIGRQARYVKIFLASSPVRSPCSPNVMPRSVNQDRIVDRVVRNAVIRERDTDAQRAGRLLGLFNGQIDPRPFRHPYEIPNALGVLEQLGTKPLALVAQHRATRRPAIARDRCRKAPSARVRSYARPNPAARRNR